MTAGPASSPWAGPTATCARTRRSRAARSSRCWPTGATVPRPACPCASSEGPTALPVAPHVLAARSGAPVLMCFGLYEGGNRYRIEFVEFGPAAPAASRGAALQPVVDRYAALLEAVCAAVSAELVQLLPLLGLRGGRRMINALLRRIGLGLALAWVCAASAADALTVAQLQRLLQSSPRQAVAYQELRESPWLAAPMTSRGTMHSTPEALEKRVESPRQETWRLLPDRVEWVGPGATDRKQIMFSDAPALAMLSDVMRRVVAGDLVALERDFKIELRGDERAWTAQLQPRKPEIARAARVGGTARHRRPLAGHHRRRAAGRTHDHPPATLRHLTSKGNDVRQRSVERARGRSPPPNGWRLPHWPSRPPPSCATVACSPRLPRPGRPRDAPSTRWPQPRACRSMPCACCSRQASGCILSGGATASTFWASSDASCSTTR